jgi:predicted MFS family arabinose efflux permease
MATLTVSSFVSFVLVMPLTKFLSPRRLLLCMYTLRFGSGIVYCAALREQSMSTLPLLYVSRVLYGLSLMTFAIPAIWIACRLPVEERAAKVTQMQGALTLGIVLGPSWGAFLASLMPTDWQGYTSVR